MMVSTNNQAYVFLATVYGGLLLGIAYDLYRVFRAIVKPGRGLSAVFDSTFWIVAALFTFYLFFRITSGEIRLYAIVGLILGWGLYSLSVGDHVVRYLVRSCRLLIGIFCRPIKIIIGAVKKIIHKIKTQNKNSLD